MLLVCDHRHKGVEGTSSVRRQDVLLNVSYDDVMCLRLRLVREIKIFGCQIGCFGDVGRGFRILIKKTNYIARLCETNLLSLINSSLAHVSIVALMANHGLISLKTLFSRFLTKLCN